jgi:hypothetical protein
MSKRTRHAITDVAILFLFTWLLARLKMAGVVDWPWWWVVSPIWIFTLAAVLVLCVGAIRGER